MTALKKKFGKRLSNLRGKQSQTEFAARLGISRGYLSDLERGAREVSLTTLARICKKTGLTPNALIG